MAKVLLGESASHYQSVCAQIRVLLPTPSSSQCAPWEAAGHVLWLGSKLLPSAYPSLRSEPVYGKSLSLALTLPFKYVIKTGEKKLHSSCGMNWTCRTWELHHLLTCGTQEYCARVAGIPQDIWKEDWILRRWMFSVVTECFPFSITLSLWHSRTYWPVKSVHSVPVTLLQ